MAFEPLNLSPMGFASETINRVWYYRSLTDTIADITADGYITLGDTGLVLGDIILAEGTDGPTVISIQSIGGGGSINTSGGTITPSDVILDPLDPILPDIGGTIVPEDLQRELEKLHQRLNLKVQNATNIGTGTSVFGGTNTADPSNRILNMRRITAGVGIEVTLSNDSIVITNTDSGTPPPGGGSDGSKIPAPPADFGFANGTRLLYVTKDGTSNPIGGETANLKFTTIQAALNAANPDDVILVRSATYRETPSLTNFAGTASNPLWIVAEERGLARVTDLWPEADNGQAGLWTDDGGGVYFSTHPQAYIGSHNGDFLMYFKTEADLRATAVDGVTKPQYGFASVLAENRIYVRLRNGINPNGQQVKITDSFSQPIFDLNNADNVIIDGFVVEGAGNTRSIEADDSCANLLVRNCVFTHCRFGVRLPSGATIDTCEYRHTGFGEWAAEVFALDGANNGGVFTLAKNYYNGTVIGGNSANALLEGSLDFGKQGTPATGCVIDKCLMGPCFDGSRIGRLNNSILRNSVMFQCRDDGFQNESSDGAQTSTGNEIHDCRFLDCSSSGSHQGGAISGNAFVYRNVFENRDARFFRNSLNVIKMLQTPAAADIQWYHNTIINLSAPGATNQFVWYDFSNGTANRLENFLNNIVIYPGTLTNGAGPNPQTVAANALVAPAANGNIQGSGGVFAGTAESDMDLASDLALTASSPAVGIGTTLPGGLPDSRSGAGVNDDAGAFPLNEEVGGNWPRERTTTFDLNPPSQFA